MTAVLTGAASRSAARLEARVLGPLDPESGLGGEWEALVCAHPTAGLMQSLRWAAIRAEAGSSSLHIGLFESQAGEPGGGTAGEALVGGVLWHGPAAGVRPAVLVAPEGPLIPWPEPGRARLALRAILETTRRAIEGTGVVALRVEPRMEPPVPSLLRDFSRAPVDLCPPETLYLDLRPSEEDLLAAMAAKWRYNIRLATRHGVTVREDSSPAAVSQLYSVIREAAGRGEFFLEPLPFFAALHQHLVRPGLARIILAEWEGQLLGAMLLVIHGDRATYLYGGTSNLERQRMAGYALQWAAINAAKSAGCSTYDFYGYEPYGDPDHLFAGFSRFKRGFGGTAKRFIGAHELILVDSLADSVIRFMNHSPAPRPTPERTPQ